MASRTRLALFLATFLAFILAVPVFAGGWAVITLDKLPGQVRAAEPITIGFTVRQHGRTLLAGLTPTISARLSGSDQAVVADAAENGTGHYTAYLTLPQSGQWEWSIQAFTMEQAMPALDVLPPASQESVPAPVPGVPLVWLGLGAAGLAALGVLLRKRVRLAVPLGIAALGLGLFGLVSAGAQAAPSAQPVATAELSPAEIGKQLFVAKGCTTCHAHRDISRSQDGLYIDAGPNLTKPPRPEPTFLRAWLADPQSVKPATEMPNLKLGSDEIEQLVAFLTH